MALPQPPFRVRTIYSWSGAEEDDLGFIEGDIIEVDDLGDGNWWHGRLKRNRMTGNFPSNYVELIKADINGFNSSTRLQQQGRSTSPEPPYAKLQSRPQQQQTQHEDAEMQFSFQSSRNYYKTQPQQTQQQQQQQQSPYTSHQLPHSHSMPAKMQQRMYHDTHMSSVSRDPPPPQHQPQAFRGQSYSPAAPPLPHHSVPVKSKSSYNVPTMRKMSPEPQSRSHQQQGFVVPYDPETLHQSKSSGSGSNVFSYSNGSYFNSSQSSNESAFAMSDFSATSAGSYSRHQWEEQQRRSQSQLNTSASGNQLLVSEKRVKNAGGLLRKFFSVKEAPPLPTPEQLTRTVNNLTLEDRQMKTWIEFKIDLNRANSLSGKERQMREKRIRENEGYIILEPHKQLSTINNNEVYQTEHKIELNTINLRHVDSFVRKLQSTTTVMSPEAFITNEFGMKYSSKLEFLRALFVLCTEGFKVRDSRSVDKMDTPNPDELFHYRSGTPYELSYLFKHLSELMGLKSELIEGSLKTPQAIVRHYWNAVLLNGEWRFIDVSMGNITNPIYEILANKTDEPSESFFFLAEPMDLIYTHIPDKYEHQHIVPPIDPMAALALPPCFPSFFKNGLKIQKFSNALTRLEGFEIFEIDLKVPKDVEVNACVITKTSSVKTLAQMYWKHNERYCKVKGHLPDDNSTGFINIFSGLKGTQKSLQNIHPLSMVIPITHEGEYRALEFVTRYPTVPAQLNDLYIKQPQNRNLSYNAEYVFSIAQHPASGLGHPAAQGKQHKIALQSPSGKIIKFVKLDERTVFGVWELPVKCSETGVWRGLVSVDSGASLCVFAEWECH